MNSYNAEEVQWAGLGGVNSGALEQDGTANYVRGLSNHQAWWEILPKGIAPVNIYASAGYAFEARTDWISATKVDFVFYNYHTDEPLEVVEEGSFSSDRSTADYIVERPLNSEGEKEWFYPLARYGDEEFGGLTNSSYIDSFPYNKFYMFDKEETLLSAPSELAAETVFDDDFQICGTKTVIKE